MTATQPPALQRVGPFCRLPGLLEDMGVEPARIFAPYGIDPLALRADSYLPLADCIGVLHAAVEATRCEHLGLLLGSRLKLADVEPLASLMKSAPTLKDALLDYVTWQPRFSNAAVAYFHGTRGVWYWGYATYDRTSIGSRQLYHLAMAAGARILEELIGRGDLSLEIHLPHDRPARSAVFEQILRAPVIFNQIQACLVMGDDTIHTAIASHDPKRRSQQLIAFRSLLAERAQSTSDTLKHYLRPNFLRNDYSLESAAQSMNTHPRTLRRKLLKEGTTFENLVAEVRCTMACELLAMTQLTLGEISDVLGYSVPSNFSHAFKRWTGITPSAWRDARH